MKLLAPNGKPSNLTPEQYKLVRTKAFKDWFGDWENNPSNASKVVDENGEPLVVFHGSEEDFNTFKSKTEVKYFAKNKEYAEEFGDKIYECFLNIRKLLNAEKFYLKEVSFEEIKNFLIQNGIDVKINKNDKKYFSKFWLQIATDNNIVDKIKLKYDGFSMYENYETTYGEVSKNELKTKDYCCFYPNQIKLADGTNTTFDGINPDIRFKNGGSVGVNNDITYEIIDDEFGFLVLIKNNNEKIGEIFFEKDRDNSFTITDAVIDTKFKGNRIYPNAIIEILNRKPNITINSVFRSSDAEKSWDYLLKNLPKNIQQKKQHFKDENTTLYQISVNKNTKYDDGGSILLAPNGKPSNLTPEQYKLVRTPAFKKWFGDWENDPANASKVVDENGEPLVLSRGNLVNQEDLGYTFNLGQNFLKKQIGNQFGFFFTNQIDIAKKYMLVDHFDEIRGGSITNVFIKSNKTLDLKDFDLKISQDNFVKGLIEKGVSFHNEYNYLRKKILDFDSDTYKYWGYNVFDYFDVFPELRNLFLENGFNSVIFYEMSRSYSKYKVYVAFHSNQIKLADGSNTTFDSSNDDIRYELGGEVKNIKLFHGNKSGNKIGSIIFDDKNYFYLTPIYRYALDYAKGNFNGVNEYEIDKSRLLDLRSLRIEPITSKYFYEKTKQYFPSKLLSKNTNKPLWELVRLDFDGEIKKVFSSRGFDGLIMIENKNNELFESYVLFNSKPIKKELTTNNPDIRFEDGGLIDDIFVEDMYSVVIDGDSYHDIIYDGKDYDYALYRYNSIEPDDFLYPNGSHNHKLLRKYFIKYKFVGEVEDGNKISDYIDYLDNSDYWEVIEESEWEELSYDDVAAVNKRTDEIIDEIRDFINSKYVHSRYGSKYMDIYVYDDEDDEIDYITIRVADHSQNPRNRTHEHHISFVIANKNETKDRFRSRDEYYYDDDDDIEYIKSEIESIIDEKIEEIKQERYEQGGVLNNLFIYNIGGL